MLPDVQKLQDERFSISQQLIQSLDDGSMPVADAETIFNDNAKKIVSEFWELSDYLIMKWADGYCNFDCGDEPRHVGYDDCWLEVIMN